VVGAMVIRSQETQISFSKTFFGKRRSNRLIPVRLRWPVQCEGTPTLPCSSKIVTWTPSFAACKAEKEPVGPAPTTTTSELTRITFAVFKLHFGI